MTARERTSGKELAQEAESAACHEQAVPLPAGQLLLLQATAGNQAVARMLAQSRGGNRLLRGNGSDTEEESQGRGAVTSPEKERKLLDKAKAYQQVDFNQPADSSEDEEDLRDLLSATVVPQQQGAIEEIDALIAEIAAQIRENRRARNDAADESESSSESEYPQSASESEAEDDEYLADDEASEDPVAVFHQQVEPELSDAERDEPSVSSTESTDESTSSSEEEEVSSSAEKATDSDLDLATDLIDEHVDMLDIHARPEDPDKVDLAALSADLQAAGDELAKAAKQRKQPGAAKAAATESVETLDKFLGPSAEASATWAPGQLTGITGPLITGTGDSGGGLTGADVVGTDAFFTGFSSTGDAVGGLARVITGVRRAHEGRKTGNRSDLVGGLLDVLNGLGTAVKSGAGIAAKFLADAAPKALGIFGSILGVVLGTITSIRYAVATGKAFTRKKTVRGLQHDYEDAAREARGKGGARAKEDYAFYRTMRAAAFVMKHKSGRRGIKKAIGLGGAGLSVIGGVFLTAGIFGLANIWNPVGWAIGGAAALIALGLTAWAIYRRLRRDRNRRELTGRASQFDTGSDESMPRESAAIAPSQYAEFIIREAKCSDHANSLQHQWVASEFVRRILGTKRGEKLLKLPPEKAVKQLSKKFGS